jgi:hypothetical protein
VGYIANPNCRVQSGYFESPKRLEALESELGLRPAMPCGRRAGLLSELTVEIPTKGVETSVQA